MTDDRVSGLALIAGSMAGIVTMSLHPTGRDLFLPGQFATMTKMAVATHAVALISLPVMFLGTLGLSRRLSFDNRLVLAAIVTYGFATVAEMNAAVMSGLVNTSIARQIAGTVPESSGGWRLLFNYTGYLNQSFALVLVVASSAAIVLWSAAIVRGRVLARGVGIYGCILGPVTVIAVFSGHLRLDVHGFGLIVLGQALWFIIVGALLFRTSGDGQRSLLSESRIQEG
jgi:hypothetical protein